MRITIELDDKEVSLLKKRAKENLLTLKEQIHDIVRRSLASYKKGPRAFHFDDKLIGIFSRQKSGRKKKVKKESKKKGKKK